MRHVLAILALAGAALAQAPGKLPAWEEKAYPLIHPPAGGLKYREIPWHTSLADAIKEARAEKRPIFLWFSGDPPLERC
jgi:hypothetical protein